MTVVWALDSVPVAVGTWGLLLLLESSSPSLQDSALVLGRGTKVSPLHCLVCGLVSCHPMTLCL